MDISDRFTFEDDGFDFPFYNGIPKLSKSDWILLFLSFILCVFYFYTPFELPAFMNQNQGIVLFIVTVLPVLYVIRDDVGLMFRKISKNDFKWIILCFLGYYVYAFVLVLILRYLGIGTISNSWISGSTFTILELINVFLQILGEELFKIVPFLILLYVFYSKTHKRKLAIVLSALIVIMVFGLLHYTSYSGNWIQIIFIIGLGSVFQMFLYVKTKNVTATYILHVFVDFLVFLTTILGIFGIRIF